MPKVMRPLASPTVTSFIRQGIVYMQNRLVQAFLPHYGIIFLPQGLPGVGAGFHQDRKRRKPRHVLECLTSPLCEEAMESVFLSSLLEILRRR